MSNHQHQIKNNQHCQTQENSRAITHIIMDLLNKKNRRVEIDKSLLPFVGLSFIILDLAAGAKVTLNSTDLSHQYFV